MPLSVEWFLTTESLTPAQAGALAYQPVTPGTDWGPIWGFAWFRIRGQVPREWRGSCVALRFSCGTEATLFRDGVPFHGFDPMREIAVLWERAEGGEEIDLLVEGACNLPLGATTFWWDQPEIRERWSREKPGEFRVAELARFDPAAHREEVVARATAAAHALPVVNRLIVPDDPRANCEAPRAGHRSTCVAVGHAHIDTAWLWTIACTRRKCLRTFSTVLRLMERFPRFRFLCSQAQQYAFVEEDSPELFAQIRARVADGRWEPEGGMWIEPDCHAPSGESLIRQVMHGRAYWQSRFGTTSTFLYLPDTFGFPASLPQIARMCGLHAFVTNKLSWNETNRFPFVSFRWKGIDGTEIASHCTPGHNYNSAIEPKELAAGAANLVRHEGEPPTTWLQPYGFGDGGGGPTAEQCVRAEMYADFLDFPRVEQRSAASFCEELIRDAARLPRLEGELYLEMHRGTYTSQAWIKQANRQCERRLRSVEACAAVCGSSPGERAFLDGAWKTVLLHQFHDILPGSSIKAVYDDARAIMGPLTLRLREAEHAGLVALGERVLPKESGECLVVFNPSSTPQTGLVETQSGAVVVAEGVPPLGFLSVRAAPRVRPQVGDPWLLCNEYLEAILDGAGRIASLRRVRDGRVANARDESGQPLPLNQWVLYRDTPRAWEAWDIDREYMDHASPVTDAARMRREDRGDRSCVVFERSLGARSRAEVRYEIFPGAPFVAIRVRIDWREEQTLLRALFPTAVSAREATYGIPFGALARANHEETPHDRAKFEVPGHGWMDISEAGFGLAVLDDGTKYGRSARGGTLGLSLLRCPNFPDPTADRGVHEFSYAVMLHDGDWRAAGVAALAEQFGDGLRVVGSCREAGARWAPFEIKGAAAEVAAFKPAEDGDGVIVRLVERHGTGGEATIRWTITARSVDAVDALERPFVDAPAPGRVAREFAPRVSHEGTTTRLSLRPFGIVTLRVRA